MPIDELPPGERELAEEAYSDDEDEEEAGGETKEPMTWERAFTMLKAQGHTLEDILEMSPKEFYSFLGEAVYIENQKRAFLLAALQALAPAAIHGNYELMEALNEKLSTEHKQYVQR